MTIRELVCDAYDSTLDGIARQCELEGSKKAATEIAAEVLDNMNCVIAAIADDGRIDENELAACKTKFAATLAERVPDESFWFLGTVWGFVKSWLKRLQAKLTKSEVA